MSRSTLALLTLLMATALLATFTPSANAAGYDVHACDASWPSAANNSFAAVADGGLTAYSGCPAGSGITVRNVWDNGNSGFLQGAYQIFDAPPGTYVGSVDFDAGLQRHTCVWGASMVAGGPDLAGTVVWGDPAGQACDGWQTPGDNSFFPFRWSVPVNASRLRIEVRCGASSCPRNGVTALRLRNVVVHVVDNAGPSLTGGRGALWTSDGWLSGSQSVGFGAADGSGISRATVQVDGRDVAQVTNPCDYTLRVPCSPASVDQTFPTAGFGSDGSHTVTLQAYDAAGNVSSVSRTVLIDNTPPDAPQGLALDGDGGWRAANAFRVHWATAPSGAGAPIVGANWRMCLVADPAQCVSGSADEPGITSLDHLSVPSPGAWALHVWLRDAAGNQDARLAADPVVLRYDDSSPQVALQPLSAADPTLVVAPASDSGSGLAGGAIEIRKVGAARWHALDTQLTEGALQARIDDQHLSDGSYQLQARAIDQAGNEKVTQSYADGGQALVTLPLRLKTVLTAGVVRRSHGRVRLVRAAFASYGRLVQVRGRLTTPEGNPMQGVTVTAYAHVRGSMAPPRLVATVKTSKTGRFSFLVRRGPSRTIRITYGGAAQIRSAERRVVLYVRSATTLRPSRHRLVNGETVRFTGRVLTGRIPRKGKIIELEVLLRGRWHTFGTARADRRGRWHYDYRFDGTQGIQVYRFRAAIPRESNYPFAQGGSRVIKVEVDGT